MHNIHWEQRSEQREKSGGVWKISVWLLIWWKRRCYDTCTRGFPKRPHGCFHRGICKHMDKPSETVKRCVDVHRHIMCLVSPAAEKSLIPELKDLCLTLNLKWEASGWWFYLVNVRPFLWGIEIFMSPIWSLAVCFWDSWFLAHIALNSSWVLL